MKQFIFVLMLTIITSAETVKKIDICTCEQISIEANCKIISTCTWNPPIVVTDTPVTGTGSCKTLASTRTSVPKIGSTSSQSTTPKTIISTYCQLLGANCWKTFGCAYVDSKCTYFTGCSAYVRSTNQECQAISQSCISDGKQCFDLSQYVDGKSCNQFTTQTDCIGSISISGNKKCKWDVDACRDYLCSEADNTLKTDFYCNAWLQGCITTGKGCTTALGPCDSYLGNDMTCLGLIGSDGNCRGIVNGTNCHLEGCSDAPETLVTDKDCNSYYLGCITKGRGCTTSPLSLCSFYQAQCLGYIGSDGPCEVNMEGTSCQARICTNAPASNIHDSECEQYKPGCLSNGRGCVSIREPCSKYSIQQCDGYIGSDGYCQSTQSNTICSAKVCEDAPIYFATEDACRAYQIGCFTTGKGCITKRGNCSSYKGTIETCEGYIGSDGKCKGTEKDINSPCTPKICTEAPASIATNEGCNSYQIGCVTNGIGCLPQTTCPNTIKQQSCSGTSGCSWNSICVSNQYCSNFKTLSICKGNNAIKITDDGTQYIPCYWEETQCTELKCSQASFDSNTTDSVCDSFLKGCVTNGKKGCLSPTDPCSSYEGTKATCEGFTRKCSNSETANPTTMCSERACTDNKVATTDQDCVIYLSGCRTNGAGCIEDSKSCSEYSGNQSKCDGFIGSNNTQRCWNISTTETSTCIEKLCTHNTSSKSDYECGIFLNGCVTNGLGCVSKTLGCSSYSGTQQQCSNFKGNNGTNICWNINDTSPCTEKLCSLAPNDLNSDIYCDMFFTGCLTNGHGCVSSSLPCTSYSGTVSQCSAFTGNKQKCYNNYKCEVRTCSGISNPMNDDDCKRYLSTCSYFKGFCTLSTNCTSYLGYSLESCDVLNIFGVKCWWSEGSTNCIDRSCSIAPVPSKSIDCSNYLKDCQFNGSVCLTTGGCTSYTAFGIDKPAMITNCELLKNLSGAYCGYNIGGNCTDRECVNAPSPINQNSCDQYLKDQCSWNGTICVPKSICSAYIPAPPSGFPSHKSIICNGMKDSISTNYCTFYNGICKPKVCNTKTNAASVTDCTNYLSTCRYTGVPICVTANENCNYEITGISQQAKLAACELLKSTSGAWCTFGDGPNTCKLKICSDVLNPTNQDSCTAVKISCRFSVSGQPCVDTNSSCSYSIPSNITVDANKIAYCQALGDGSGNSCDFTSGTSICHYKKCSSSGPNPANLQACTAIKSSCQFISNSVACLEADVGCAYNSTSGNELAYCKALNNGSGIQCNWTVGQTTCRLGVCGDVLNPTNQVDCTALKSSCQYSLNGQPCVDTNSACAYTFPDGFSTDPDKTAYCQTLEDGSGNSCGFTSGTTVCRLKICGDLINPTDQAACTAIKSSCKFSISGQPCVETNTTCTYLLPLNLTNKLSYCLALNNGSGKQCGYTSGSTTCSYAECSQIITAANSTACQNQISNCEINSGCLSRSCDNLPFAPTSNLDCINWSSDCRFNGQICIQSFSSCEYIFAGTIASGSDVEKLSFCKLLTNSFDIGCTLNLTKTGCIQRKCTNFPTIPKSINDCTNWLPTCRYDGYSCINADSCDNYIANSTINITIVDDKSKETYCLALKNNDDPPISCGFVNNGNSCSERTCANIRTPPNSDYDCNQWLASCTISNEDPPVCILNTSPCTAFTGTASQCQSFSFFSGNSKIKCWSVSEASATSPIACKTKECTDDETSLSTDECSKIQPDCRYNGTKGCVLSPLMPCSSYLGNSVTCATFKSIDGAYCAVGTDQSKACTIRVCSDNNDSITNADCDSFLTGCVTRGKGCIRDTEPCTQYQGTLQQCLGFRGNGKQCWNSKSATASSYCVDLKCSDDETSTNDSSCTQFSQECVTKGVGCIESASQCSAYQGNQTSCSYFKGLNGTKLCWNTSTASSTSPCIDKQCHHNTSATSDADCDVFIPRASNKETQKCVTNGAGCVDYTTPCSSFIGTTKQCSLFTASDGPCKSTSATMSASCTPKICAEALNSNNTDALCKAYHPSCVTSGYGCVTSIVCQDIQQQSACKAKSGCSLVQNCQTIQTDCSAFTIQGASVCTNTPVTTGSKKCAWHKNECRAQTSEDLPAFLTTHQACQEFSTSYTTTGSGCTIMGPCISYSSEVVCKVAMSTDVGQTCVWDTDQTACRARKCIDVPAQITDAGCDSYLTGCKTNGISCIAGGFSCPSLLTVGSCILDDQNKPCLWVNDLCYNFTKCEDISKTTHDECQKFSPQCTTSGDKCIAITTCDKTTNQQSCRIGTDGTCGWLPAQKCQKFKACSDAAGISPTQCALYGSNCITDGTKCTDKGQCSTYLTQLACDQSGTDGPCIFNLKGCRIRECSDATSSNASIDSHSGCNSYIANTQCTTNGTSCIPLSTCSSYTVEVGCVLGTDGSCIFSLPVGSTTGTRSCRLLACSDFQKTTSSECSESLIKVGIQTECVSDGTICFAKAACTAYTSKEACNGGGTDGNCAFTPGSTDMPEVGSCKLMTSCADANSDSLACIANSDACDWFIQYEGTKITSSCIPHTCSTKGLGSTCVPVPSFDHETYTICGYTLLLGCTEVPGSALSNIQCQELTMKTYTWNENKCLACFTVPASGNNSEEHIGPTYSNLVKSLVPLIILAFMAV